MTTSKWKAKGQVVEIIDSEREIHIVVARYDNGPVPSARHIVTFPEHSSKADVAAKLRELADKIEA